MQETYVLVPTPWLLNLSISLNVREALNSFQEAGVRVEGESSEGKCQLDQSNAEKFSQVNQLA